MLRLSLSALALLVFVACGDSAETFPEDPAPTADVALSAAGTAPAAGTAITRIAVGSCNRENLPQPIWDAVLEADPELWVWLGDNVYGDTNDMSVMRAKYETQLAHPGYTALRETAAILGTWDDHDYGQNNAGKEYPMRAESQQAALDFLGVPADDPRREREGLYSSTTFGPEGQRVKVILLDSRYHRDERGSDGAILGEEQWSWLQAELTDSDAQMHLIGNGIQILPEDHRFEKWANFPSERRRLIDLIAESGAPGVVLLSGDRHLSEITRIEHPAMDYALHELTSSGLTHSYETGGDEVNRHRIGDNFTELSFGLVEIDWDHGQVSVEARDVEGAPARSVSLSFEELGIPR